MSPSPAALRTLRTGGGASFPERGRAGWGLGSPSHNVCLIPTRCVVARIVAIAKRSFPLNWETRLVFRQT